MAGDDRSWKQKIIHDLQERNRRECEVFTPIIISHNRLLESSETFRSCFSRLHVEADNLKAENAKLKLQISSGLVGAGGGCNDRGEKTLRLKQKIFKLQEELTELHRKKGENVQQLIDLNSSLKEKEKEASVAEIRIKELEGEAKALVDRSEILEQQLNESCTVTQCLRDELAALQMAYTVHENRLRHLEQDNADLVARWMAQKQELANKMNAENDAILVRRRHEMQRKILAAAEKTVAVDFGRSGSTGDVDIPMVGYAVTIPSRALQIFEAHDGEVNAIRWAPSGRAFATGASDRKLKLWEVRSGKAEIQGVLVGSGAGVMSVQFDSEDSLVLAASNDFACRVWTCNDLRLRSTLTGHVGKALAAKFLNGSNQVVSGSYDRTIKLWDLRSITCTRTIFAGSSCNDLAVLDDSHIISGHFDRTVRLWDVRGDKAKAINEIVLSGRVTALDLSADKSCLLACARDETISIIDLKMAEVTTTLSCEGFRTTTDWTRAVFSPDAAYVAAGSVDGGLYIWEVATGKVHSVLKEHRHGSILSCSWNPNGRSVLSCDKHKTVVYWSDI